MLDERGLVLTHLPVNEVFPTIQGEAGWTGTPCIFVRLQGCDVACAFCDTKHTWAVDPTKECSTSAMLTKGGDSDLYAQIDVPHLVGVIKQQSKARHVVITGGEPCMYDLSDLTGRLIAAGYTVQIETSGTEPIRCHDDTWVTLSPKIAMPGGKVVQADAYARANEIKLPVGRPADIARFQAAITSVRQHIGADVIIWLQPLSTSRKATELCIQAATDNGFRVSVQTHKFIGVR